jgi:flagellar assembly factor FliW
MQLAGTKFGNIEVDEAKTIAIPGGLIGFANLRRYVLLEPRGKAPVGWLQSLELPALAFPVVDGAAVGPDYPDPGGADLAKEAGLGHGEVAVMVVVAAAAGRGLVANLLAPIVVDLSTRTGAQVVLDPKRFSASEPLPGLSARG